mgnify:CR=1 FL=1
MTTITHNFVCRCGAGFFEAAHFMTHIGKDCSRVLPSVATWARNMLRYYSWRVRVGLDPLPKV